MPKKKTVRFYTVSGRYVDWKYASNVTYFEIKNWLKGHNYILVGDQRIDKRSSIEEIFKIVRGK